MTANELPFSEKNFMLLRHGNYYILEKILHQFLTCPVACINSDYKVRRYK